MLPPPQREPRQTALVVDMTQADSDDDENVVDALQEDLEHEEVFHGGRVARAPDTLFGDRFSMLAAADERTVTENDEVVPHEVVSAAPDMNVLGSRSRDGRRRLLLVSQDRFVMENASDVVPTHLDQEVDATMVDPTLATVPDSFFESDTASLNSRPPDEFEVEPEQWV